MWAVIMGIIGILVGILVIIRPKIIAWAVGIYLIVWGVLRIIEHFST